MNVKINQTRSNPLPGRVNYTVCLVFCKLTRLYNLVSVNPYIANCIPPDRRVKNSSIANYQLHISSYKSTCLLHPACAASIAGHIPCLLPFTVPVPDVLQNSFSIIAQVSFIWQG